MGSRAPSSHCSSLTESPLASKAGLENDLSIDLKGAMDLTNSRIQPSRTLPLLLADLVKVLNKNWLC